VHTVASNTEYEIVVADNSNASNNVLKFIRAQGSGMTHIEGNYGTYYDMISMYTNILLIRNLTFSGTFFPSGWVWAQAISSSGNQSLSLVGGKFTIGGISPISWVVYIR
jgi:hypothetical protein